MSGIINSEGSKSGLIGTNELYIKTGYISDQVFFNGGGKSYSAVGYRYTRLGELVALNFVINADNSGGAGSGVIELGLPFPIWAEVSLVGSVYASIIGMTRIKTENGTNAGNWGEGRFQYDEGSDRLRLYQHNSTSTYASGTGYVSFSGQVTYPTFAEV